MRYIMEINLRSEYRPEQFNPDDHFNQYPIDAYNYDLGMGLCFVLMAVLAVDIRILGFFFLKWQALST